jgi:hypothetical protein
MVHHSYPEENEYDYIFEPRPMSMPPIPPKEFTRRFYACYGCPPIPAIFHQCKRFTEHCKDTLDRFPKCRFEFDISKGGSRDKFWGIYAHEDIAFARVAVYNLLCMAPPLVFFFEWLLGWKHTGDLQDASIPLFVMLALLSLFWSLFLAGLSSGKAGELPRYNV